MTQSSPLDLYINGAWSPASSDAVFDDLNPASGEIYATVADANRQDVKAAIEAASNAQPAWAALPPQARAKFMLDAADAIERRKPEFAQAIVSETGSWFGKAMFETGYIAGALRAAAASVYQMNGEIIPSDYGKLSLLVREPVGVVSVITPWNFPALLTMRGVSIPMAIGNCVVVKPSELTPVTGGLLLAEIFEEVGLPAGVFNVVTCSRSSLDEVGDELIANPHVQAISFTGSTTVGKQIAQKAAGLLKTASLELGGKDPMIILDDADMQRAVDAATFGSFMHQGQICMSTERVIVHKDIADEFIEKFVAKASTLKYGDPSQPEHIIGPIINQAQLDKIQAQVDQAIAAGATVRTGGKADGPYFPATVITGITRDMDIFQNETFGPVAPVIVVHDDQEAIDVANDSAYGLSSSVITRDEERGMNIARNIQSGMCHINDCTVHDEPHAPFGGAKDSGLGGMGGRYSIDNFSKIRWVTLERGGRKYPF